MAYTYEYPRPALTVDAIIFLKEKNDTKVLLIKRKHNPFAECWAFPGGFVDKDEDVDDAIYRELNEETMLQNIKLKQLQTFGKPGRDPRGHVVSVVYYGFTTAENSKATAADDAKEAQWFSINELPDLAFDHGKIMKIAKKII